MKFEFHPEAQPAVVEAPRTDANPFSDLEVQPIVESMGIALSPKGWVFYVLRTQGDKVVGVEYGQENMRTTCVEQFKIAAQKHFFEG